MFPSELTQLRKISSRMFEGVIREEPCEYFYRIAKDLDNLFYAIVKNKGLKNE